MCHLFLWLNLVITEMQKVALQTIIFIICSADVFFAIMLIT